MSTPARRPSSRPSRRQREQRAYTTTVVGGSAALVTVVTAVLAIAGVLGWTLPLIAAVVTAVCFVLFRRAMGR
jgi:hypothetical protein